MSELRFSVFPSDNFVDLCLYQFGREKCAPLHSFGPATRNHYLFHYIISGTGTLYSNDLNNETQTYQVKSRQGFMIFPNQINTYIADEELPWEYIWVEFDGLRVREALNMAGITQNNPIYRAHTGELREQMLAEMMYMTENKGASTFSLIGHLYLFLDCFMRSSTHTMPSKGSKLSDFYIHEALHFIEQNFQNDISVEDIAEVCGLNRSYFGKVFKSVLGKTPQEFLISYRMTKAAELLKMTKMSIRDVSRAVGYEDQLHFSRAFKKVYGVSPRDWRNANRVGIHTS